MRHIKKSALLVVIAILFTSSTYVKSEDKMPTPSQDTYTVKEGDTLWNVTDQFFKNPFLWPSLWARNPKIGNPHVIYPDTTLNLLPVDQKLRKVEKVTVKEVVKEVVAPPTESESVKKVKKVKKVKTVKKEKGEEDAKPKERIEEIVTQNAQLLTAGYLTFEKPEEVAVIQGGMEARTLLDNDDVIYIDEGKSKDLKKGDAFTVVSITEAIIDKENQTHGYVVKILGEVVIDEALSYYQSRAIVTRSFDDITKGDSLVPLFKVDEKVKINDASPDIKGTKIVASKNGVISLGTLDVVYLNKGADSGIKTGNRFDVYRDSYLTAHPKYKDSQVWLPRERVGEITVIYTTEDTATAVVSNADREIMLFDDVNKIK